MNDLNLIISTFTTEEQQRFALYLDKKNKRKDAKNVKLFQLLAKNEIPQADLCQKLYNTKKSNAYHALRKRLYSSIIDFIASENLEDESSENMQIIKYILVARIFLQQQQYKMAFKLLNKAEILAKEQQLYPYLNEIYHTKIQFAHTVNNTDLNQLISTFKQNQKLYILEEELNIVYAKVRQTLNEIAFKGKVIDFETLLQQILNEHNISISESLSFKSLYQLLTIASISAFITKNYIDIETFVLDTYKTIDNNPQKRKQPYYHIQVLYMIANTLFRTKKFKQSLQYLELMYNEMQQQRGKYYNRFLLKYNLLKALNLNYSNHQDDAISILKPLINKKHQDIEALLDIQMALIVFYVQKEDLKTAYSLLSKFYHTDKWYIEKAGKEWVIKKNLIEILLHLELKHIDLFESRLLSFRRSYSAYLKDIGQQRVLDFLKIAELYYQNTEQVTSEDFYNTVEESFEWIEPKREDIFVMSFYAWLKSKMEQQPIFTTTMRLVKLAQAS